MLNVIRVELQTPFASVFLHDSIREWVLKFLEHLTPQAMLVIHELSKCVCSTDSFHVLQAQRFIANLQPPGVLTLARIFAQYESLVPFVCILDDSLALVTK